MNTSAHPRRCGENHNFSTGCGYSIGSSPQVRGKQLSSVAGSLMTRLIPAGAGKTPPANTLVTWYAAHPRRCGENFTGAAKVTGFSGSSPQVRGKLQDPTVTARSYRLIPAGAGKTFEIFLNKIVLPAHPRRCGENYLLFLANRLTAV